MALHSIQSLLKGQVELGSEVKVQGWVRTRRDSKAGFSFVVVHDGSCFGTIQVVAPSDLPEYESDVLKLTTGASVSVVGELVKSQGKGQGVEIQAKTVTLVGAVENPDTYPIQPKRHTMEFLRENAHLRVRTNTFGAMARVRDAVSQAIHRFFHEKGHFWVHTPIITASDAEGAGELFRVSTLDMMNIPKTPEGTVDFSQDFFGKESFLTVSGQLNVETYCLALSKVYTFGPTFRAENSNTSRHLAEFWMVEPEIAFAGMDENVALAEAMLKYIFKAVLDERGDDIAFFNKFVEKGVLPRMEKFISSPFERLSYTDAVKALTATKKKFEFPVSWGMDLQSEHERWLCEKHIGGPVAIVDYPKEIKAFYMRLNDDEKTVGAMDVLVPGIGEMIGGSVREERLDVFDARLKSMDLEPEVYSWYRDLRRYGTVPHAGYGLGLERILMYITGMKNIRDVTAFPRAKGSAAF